MSMTLRIVDFDDIDNIIDFESRLSYYFLLQTYFTAFQALVTKSLSIYSCVLIHDLCFTDNKYIYSLSEALVENRGQITSE